ncbi:MAG TPA: methyltransferase domain-containing protein [Thermoanaerobaculia bacterium]|jgi:hypothetical protein
MSWFSRRKPRRGELSDEVGIIRSGVQRSPGMGALSEALARRRVGSILDLGASRNENLVYLGQYCSNIVIHDVVGARGEALAAPRASLFQIHPESLALDAGPGFDVILLWDLLHYVERARAGAFAARLAELARPDALVLLLAAAATPIPLTPIRFKILDRDHLLYEVANERRDPAPRLTPRQVERLMERFCPVRSFQLRNGLQEFLFRYEGTAEPAAEAGPVEEEEPRQQKVKQPGDWY